MSVGKRIYLKRELPDPELCKAFAELPASNVADCFERNSAMNPRIHLISRPSKSAACGPAFTVKGRAGDNLMIHAAMEYVQEGDVLVVSNEEDDTRSLIGEVMISYLFYQKKIAALVIDGPIRDSEELSKWDFPIYCTGTTPGGPYKDGPGEINVPIACGGISVNPGDVILCDYDGVICIPRKEAPAILPKAQAYHVADDQKAAQGKVGEPNRDWLHKALSDKNFEIIDDVYRP